MPSSFQDYTGNGTALQWTVPFPYLNRAHVAVTNRSTGVAIAFTWVNDTTISISPAVANGTTFRIQRNTPVDQALVSFNDGSNLREADLETSQLQLLYSAQEVVDEQEEFINTAVTQAAAQALAAAQTAINDAVNSLLATQFPDNSLPGAKLVDNSVTTAKLADNSVTTAKLATAAVTTSNIANGAITAEKLAPGAIPASGVTTFNGQSGAVNGVTSVNGNTGPAVTLTFPAPTLDQIRAACAGDGGNAIGSYAVVTVTGAPSAGTNLPAGSVVTPPNLTGSWRTLQGAHVPAGTVQGFLCVRFA